MSFHGFMCLFIPHFQNRPECPKSAFPFYKSMLLPNLKAKNAVKQIFDKKLWPWLTRCRVNNEVWRAVSDRQRIQNYEFPLPGLRMQDPTLDPPLDPPSTWAGIVWRMCPGRGTSASNASATNSWPARVHVKLEGQHRAPREGRRAPFLV